MTEANPTPSPAPPPKAASKSFQTGWLVERVRGGRRRHTSALMVVLVASIGFHILLLVALAAIKFSSVVIEPPPPIRIDTDIVETFRTEPVTYRTIISADDTGDLQAPGGGGGASSTLGASSGDGVAVMDVDAVNLGGLGADLLARKGAPSFGGVGGWAKTSDLTRKVVKSGGSDYKSALDESALLIAEQVRKRKVLVTILFDESQSLLDDRDMIGKQLKKTFDDLKFEITEEEEKRLKWSVVSYSEEAKVRLRPTQDIQKVREAIARLPKDEGGQENVCKAIQYCVTEFSREADKQLIILVTDEQGDDVGLGQNAPHGRAHPLQFTVDLCQRRGVQVYVFGREAMLEDAALWVPIAALKNMPGTMVRGLAGCRQEVPQRLRHLGIGARGLWREYMPAGFGTYGLSLVADKTGGRFFILSTEKSPYKEEALQGYEPEWCYPEEYDQRTRSSKLRRTMASMIEEMPQDLECCPEWELVKETWQRQQFHFTRELAPRIDDKIKWCDSAIDRMLDLGKDAEKEKNARKRWQANYDLTLALVYKFKAQLMEYKARLEDTSRARDWPVKPPDSKQDDKGMIFVMGLNRDAQGKFAGGRDEENIRKRATQALELVVRSHAGTPWAERARIELEDLRPFRLDFQPVPLPYPPPDTNVYPKL